MKSGDEAVRINGHKPSAFDVAANQRPVLISHALKHAHVWGGGEVASADGIRFILPIRTVHAVPIQRTSASSKA
jgi:hypothetical protein